ncbi:hypothetical protein [Methanoregula sp.]|uniref:hypothetical protein n=1 Tax=Methanoregula sp. TaxID=2052170 RepID=UPI003C16DA3C
MNTDQTITADETIRSGSPDGSIRAYPGYSREKRTDLFSGVRSSGQYCCPGMHATVALQERLNPTMHQLGSASGMRY